MIDSRVGGHIPDHRGLKGHSAAPPAALGCRKKKERKLNASFVELVRYWERGHKDLNRIFFLYLQQRRRGREIRKEGG